MSVAVLHSRALAGVARAARVPSRSTSPADCPAFTWSACPIPKCARRATACAPRCRTRSSNFPQRKVTVNLAPADLPKESGRYDLPIALGILAATRADSRQRPRRLRVRRRAGADRRVARRARRAGDGAVRARDGRAFVLPSASAAEAAMVKGATVYGAGSLLAVCAHLTARAPLPRGGRGAAAARRKRARPVRRARPAAREARAGGRRGRRALAAADGPARHRQVDARAPAAFAAAAAA